MPGLDVEVAGIDQLEALVETVLTQGAEPRAKTPQRALIQAAGAMRGVQNDAVRHGRREADEVREPERSEAGNERVALPAATLRASDDRVVDGSQAAC
ncbi:MAG: hypothetical protein QNJ90_07775 [Planctomycetota bacterium]|nr:hypothetical protein [Planctomycetota bacterium]